MGDEIPKGLCQCGCGGKTNLITKASPKLGQVNGEPWRYIRGHQRRGHRPSNYNGGRTINGCYPVLLIPDHPRSNSSGYVLEHIIIAEKAFGGPLPPKAVVHHHTPEQLVICQDNSYHRLLHQRQRAYETCGHANWLKCSYCGEYDDPVSLYVRPGESQGWHRNCRNEHDKIKWRLK